MKLKERVEHVMSTSGSKAEVDELIAEFSIEVSSKNLLQKKKAIREWWKLAETPEKSILEYGDTGENVRRLQVALSGIRETGVFDTATENKLKMVQAEYRHLVTGKLDKKMVKELKIVLV